MSANSNVKIAIGAVLLVVASALPAIAVQVEIASQQSGDDGACEPSEPAPEESAESTVPATEIFETEQVKVNAFGTWAYGRTDGNHYSPGEEGGEYDAFNFALTLNATPADKLRISAQANWEAVGETEVASAVDYAFAEWTFTDHFKFRAGIVKQPFGLYTEFFDVGTVRPFTTLPQGIYGSTGFIAESYRGVGVTGAFYGGNGWGIEYDGYGGEIAVVSDEIPEFLFEDLIEDVTEAEEEEDSDNVRDMLGARVKVVTPWDGLEVGVSAYSGEREEKLGTRHTAYGFHGEYLSGPLTVRGELASLTEGDEQSSDAYYVEGAYKLSTHWEAAARWDWTEITVPTLESGSPLLEHRDVAIGLNYWFSPQFVLKFSFHNVEGNRFAREEEEAELEELFEEGELDVKTKLFVFGVQFSF